MPKPAIDARANRPSSKLAGIEDSRRRSSGEVVQLRTRGLGMTGKVDDAPLDAGSPQADLRRLIEVAPANARVRRSAVVRLTTDAPPTVEYDEAVHAVKIHGGQLITND